MFRNIFVMMTVIVTAISGFSAKAYTIGRSADSHGGMTPITYLLSPSVAMSRYFNARPRAATLTVTNTNDSGLGSLREAILNADPSDTIDFNLSGCPCTITLTTGEILIDKQLTINGPGASNLRISGNDTSRVFNIVSAAGGVPIDIITISNLTVADGNAGLSSGGGIYIPSQGVHVYLFDVAVTSNRARGGGGGIYTGGLMTVTNSFISNNFSTDNWGGGILAAAGSQLTLSQSYVQFNATAKSPAFGSQNGGGIFNDGGSILLDSILLSENTSNFGGGIYNYRGTLSIVGSTISGNTADDDFSAGGGIYNSATLNITNSTISGNKARAISVNGSYGGGIYNGGALNLTNVTLAVNTATNSVDPTNAYGGGIYSQTGAGTVDVETSIIAGNTAPTAPDVFGDFNSQGYNLIGIEDGSSGLGDLTSLRGSAASPLNPLLAPLQPNSGWTSTHALLPGSPAIDKGATATDGNGNPVTADQHQISRPIDDPNIPNAPGGNGSDIGSYEALLSPSGLTVTPAFLDFGMVPTNKTKDLILTVTNNTAAPIALAESFPIDQGEPLPFDSSNFEGCGFARTLEPGQSCTRQIRFWAVTGAGAASPAQMRLLDGGTFQTIVTVPLTASVGSPDTGPNNVPVPVDDLAGVAPGFDHELNALRNDSDPDNDLLRIVDVTDPSHGTARVIPCTLSNPNSDCIEYVPDAGYTGPDAVPYTVSDGRGGQASAVYHLAVGNVVPNIESITPSNGPASGGQTVRIAGSNFIYQSRATLICSGVFLPLDITQLTNTEILAVTPVGFTGPCDLQIATRLGQTGLLANAYQYEVVEPTPTPTPTVTPTPTPTPTVTPTPTPTPPDADGDGVPDGSDNCPLQPNPVKIAFTSDRSGDDEVYLMNSDGTNPLPITNNTGFVYNPVISPDGASVAFTNFSGGNYEIYSVRSDGTGLTNLTNNAAVDDAPAYSPDGRKIAFRSTRSSDSEIYVMNTDGTSPVRLTFSAGDDQMPAFSPDGSKIIFQTYRNGNWDVYLMNSDGSGQTPLTTSTEWDEQPTFSPDGSKIAFISNRDGNTEIYTMNSDGSGQTRVTNDFATDAYPSFSPGGSRIAFASDRSGTYDIWTMNPDGTDLTNIATGSSFDLDTHWGGQLDTDRDGQGDPCDTDDDNDGQTDADEIACGSDPLDSSSSSPDSDADNQPDCVDADDDNDGVSDAADNCPLVSNPTQVDSDDDGIGNACDPTPFGDPADLAVSVTTSPSSIIVGGNVTFTATMSNLGPSNAFTSRLNVTLPTGLQYVSDNASGACEFIGGSGTCDFDNLASGSTRVVSIVSRPTTSAPLTATFAASAPLFDTNLANNNAAVTIDASPTVTINQAPGQADPTNLSPIRFAVAFSEPVSGFAGSDVSFAGSTVGGTLAANVSGSGADYVVSVTGMTGLGTVVVSIPAGAATDSGGKPNTASTSTDRTVTYTVARVFGFVQPSNGGSASFVVVDSGGQAGGVFGYSRGNTAFTSTRIISLVISGQTATFEGFASNGRFFRAAVFDGQPDHFRLWIEGVEQTPSSGALSSGSLTVQPWGPDTRLKGWVDLHTHPMSNIAFGGKLFHGAPSVGSLMPAVQMPNDPNCSFDQRATTIAEALSQDGPTRGDALQSQCGDFGRNAIIKALESVNGAQTAPAGADGFPAFTYWPRWDDITHQKMWIDWIRRSWQYGQRVMVALSHNNRVLGDLVTAGGAGPITGGTDDEASSALQIEEIKRLVADNSSLMAVARTPEDLRSIIESGRMAVVLGVELDKIGNFGQGVTQQAIDTEIDALYTSGVRYVLPLHLTDNIFGDSAIYQDAYNLVNLTENGAWWSVGCAPRADEVGFKATSIGGILNPFLPPGAPPFPSYPSCLFLRNGVIEFDGHVNARTGNGLTSLGDYAIAAMMKRGMIVDIDHMSDRAANRTLTRAAAVPGGGYPVTSGHSGIRSRTSSNLSAENSRTTTQLARIACLGGMFGLGTDSARAIDWTSQYARGYEVMRRAFAPNGLCPQGNPLGVGFVSLGTDANSLVKTPRPTMLDPVSPRFTDIYSPGNPINAGVPALGRSSQGTKTWDYNMDGVAHYGMFTDFLRDVRTLPANATMTGRQIVDDQMMYGADYFYRMWLKADVQKSKVP